MFRLLLFCILFFILYIGFATLSVYDSEIIFSFLDYQIEITLFTFFVIPVIFTLLVLIVLKMMMFIFDLPLIIRNRIKRRHIEKMANKSILAFAYYFMGNKNLGLDTIIGVIKNNPEDNADILALILSEKETNIDDKISNLRKLLDKKNYSLYASKALAKIFYDNGHYSDAENYAVKAFNQNDTDIEGMQLLIRIYAKLARWNKLVFVVSKLTRAGKYALKEMREEIAEYYYMAAKNVLADEENLEAVKYLESALELKPDYIEALNLYTEIKLSIKSTHEALKVLKSAYKLSPSFEIAELYILASRCSPEAAYSSLANIVDPKCNTTLYLAIAAYLGLQDRIQEIKERKLIGYEG